MWFHLLLLLFFVGLVPFRTREAVASRRVNGGEHEVENTEACSGRIYYFDDSEHYYALVLVLGLGLAPSLAPVPAPFPFLVPGLDFESVEEGLPFLFPPILPSRLTRRSSPNKGCGSLLVCTNGLEFGMVVEAISGEGIHKSLIWACFQHTVFWAWISMGGNHRNVAAYAKMGHAVLEGVILILVGGKPDRLMERDVYGFGRSNRSFRARLHPLRPRHYRSCR